MVRRTPLLVRRRCSWSGGAAHGPGVLQVVRGCCRWSGGALLTIVAGVSNDQPSTEELRRRQLDQERAEREQLAEADTDADADRHRRRAEKAGYLRRKLQEREHAEQAGDGDSPPPSAD